MRKAASTQATLTEISHWSPKYSSVQLQSKPLTRSTHVALLRQVALTHSSMSVWQLHVQNRTKIETCHRYKSAHVQCHLQRMQQTLHPILMCSSTICTWYVHCPCTPQLGIGESIEQTSFCVSKRLRAHTPSQHANTPRQRAHNLPSVVQRECKLMLNSFKMYNAAVYTYTCTCIDVDAHEY